MEIILTPLHEDPAQRVAWADVAGSEPSEEFFKYVIGAHSFYSNWEKNCSRRKILKENKYVVRGARDCREINEELMQIKSALFVRLKCIWRCLSKT